MRGSRWQPHGPWTYEHKKCRMCHPVIAPPLLPFNSQTRHTQNRLTRLACLLVPPTVCTSGLPH